MQDFHEFQPYEPNQQKPQRNRNGGVLLAIIAVALVFSILGGITAVALSRGRTTEAASLTTPAPAGTQLPAATEEATRTATAQQNLPVIGGAALYLTGDNPVVEIAEKVGPSVVGISNRQVITSSPYGGFFGRGTPQTSDPVEASSGSGVIISADGYILTNCHVVSGATTLVVTLPGGEELPATLIGEDSASDLAVIKVDRTNLPAAPLGDSDQLRVGELAVAIGNPLGQELAGTVTAGIISALNRTIDYDYQRFTMIQTDAAINPGNSGGALINSRGEVVGINSMKSGGVSYDGTTIEGIGFAIPINSARAIAQELIANGKIDYPMIGITSTTDISSLQSVYNIPNGIFVDELSPGGPAEKGGVLVYDIITHIDGVEVASLARLRSELYQHKPGDVVTLTIFRDAQNSALKIQVTLVSSASLLQEEEVIEPTPTPWPQWPTR